jgi:hypothetical protein
VLKPRRAGLRRFRRWTVPATASREGKAQPLATGSFFALPPEMAHYAFADKGTVVQLNTIGPRGIKYVNPKDDPRGATQ